MENEERHVEVSVLIPCLNESKTIGDVVQSAHRLFAEHGISGEVVVADNGSTDGSQHIAEKAGAYVVIVRERGYGAAYNGGLESVRGNIVLMADADNTYHIDEAYPLIEKIRNGADMVIGNRLRGKKIPGGLTWKSRYLGTPIISWCGRLFFGTKIGDYNGGMRAAKRDVISSLKLVTTGMEWASETIIKARLAGYAIEEVPVTLYPDPPERKPHLRPFADGWRHMRFLLLHAPKWLFVFPGLILSVLGMVIGVPVWLGPVSIGGLTFGVHTLLIASVSLLIGIQILYTGVFARMYAYKIGLLPEPKSFGKKIMAYSLERMLLISIGVGLIGVIAVASVAYSWVRVDFQGLDVAHTFRQLIPGVTLIMLGIQMCFFSFLLGVLRLEIKK